jgi:hypothetical protein
MTEKELYNQLPPNLKKIVEYISYDNNLSAPLITSILSVYSRISRMMCDNRCKLQSSKSSVGYVYPSLAVLAFVKSGGYKDAVIKSVDSLCVGVDELKEGQINERYKDYLDRKGKEIEKAKNEGVNKTLLRQLEESYVRKPQTEVTKPTPQALYADLRRCQEIGFGSVYFHNSEIVGLIKKKDTNLFEIFDLIKDLISDAKMKPHEVIGEYREAIKDVPATMFLYSSQAGINNNGESLNEFISSITTGLGRRALFVIANKDRVVLTIDQARECTEKALSIRQDCVNIMNNVYKHISKGTAENSLTYGVDVIMGDGVEEYMNEMRNENIVEGKRSALNGDDIRVVEVNDRFLRAYILSALVAMLEHPEDPVISVDDYVFAYDIVEICGEKCSEFMGSLEQEDVVDIMYRFIKENDGVSKTKIADKAKIHSRDRWKMDGMFKTLEDICKDNDEELVKDEWRKTHKYRIIKLTDKYNN